MTPRILVVGAGAIGGVAAARLARAGSDVSVLDADAGHVRAMSGPGLRYDELGSESQVRIPAVTHADELSGRFDYALITLKAAALAPALGPLVAVDLVDTYVCLGNGLVQDIVAGLVGADRMLVGIVEWGATNLGTGHLRQTTIAPTVVGEADGTDTSRVRRLAQALAPVGEVQVSGNVLAQVWSKLLLNSTFSGLGAISGLVYRDAVALPHGESLAIALWTEGYGIARAVGVVPTPLLGISAEDLVVDADDSGDGLAMARAALATLMARVGATKASMLQDLERGARTEVDVINGGVVSAARRAGRRAPLNEELVAIVHDCERAEQEPGPAALARLSALVPPWAGQS